MMKVTIIIYLGVQFKLWYIIIMIVKWLYNDTLRGYIQTNGGYHNGSIVINPIYRYINFARSIDLKHPQVAHIV